MARRLMWFLVVALIVSAVSAALAQVEQDRFDGQRALSAAQEATKLAYHVTATVGSDWQKAAFTQTNKGLDFAASAKRSGETKFYRFSIKNQKPGAAINLGILNQITSKPGDTSNEWDALVDWGATDNLKLGLSLPISSGAAAFSPAWEGKNFKASADLSPTKRPVYNLSTTRLRDIKLAASHDADNEETTYSITSTGAGRKQDLIIQYVDLAGDAGYNLVIGMAFHFGG